MINIRHYVQVTETDPLPDAATFGANLIAATEEAMLQVGIEAVQIARQKLEERSPYGLADGPTYQSGHIEEVPEGDGIGADVVFGHAAHWVEFGRGPGKAPPVNIMRSWVEKKLGFVGGKRNSVAYAIGQKIARLGIVPTFFMFNTKIEVEYKMPDRLRLAFWKALGR